MTGAEVRQALHDGVLLVIKALVVVAVLVGLALAVGDYRQARSATAYLEAPTGVTDPQGHMLMRRDLIDLALRDVVQRQQAAHAKGQ